MSEDDSFYGELPILVIAAAIASGAGSAGGSMFIPTLFLVFQESSFVAYTKSCNTATVATVSIINIITEIIARRQSEKAKNSFLNNQDNNIDNNLPQHAITSTNTNPNPKNNNKPNNPYKKNNFIRYDIACQMVPIAILGACIGVRLHKMLPFFVIAILLILLFSISTLKAATTVAKVIKKPKDGQERRKIIHMQTYVALEEVFEQARKSIVASDDVNYDDNAGLELAAVDRLSNINEPDDYVNESNNTSDNENNDDNNNDDNNNDNDGGYVISSDSGNDNNGYVAYPIVPWKNIFLIIATWIFTLFLNFALGGEGSDSIFGIECGSVPFWLLAFCTLLFLISIYAIARKMMTRKIHKTEEEFYYVGYSAAIAAFFAGLASGTLGTGASTIQAPFLLNIIPSDQSKQASATSAFVSICIESTAFSVFVILGLVNIKKGLIYGFCALIGAIIGKIFIYYMTKKKPRHWLVPSFLVAYIGIGLIALIIMCITQFIKDINYGFWKSNELIGLCEEVSGYDGFW